MDDQGPNANGPARVSAGSRGVWRTIVLPLVVVGAALLLTAIVVSLLKRDPPQLAMPESVAGQSQLDGIELRFSIYDDAFLGGSRAVGFSLFIKNNTTETIDDIRLTVNDAYKASLSDLLYYFGPFSGCGPFGATHLSPGQSLGFSFDHDVGNHSMLLDAEGKSMPSSIPPKTVVIESNQSACLWRLASP